MIQNMKKNYLLHRFLLVLFCCFLMGCGKKNERMETVDVGDVVEFGMSLSENQILKWIVLECDGDEALLLSEEIITYRRFHQNDTSIEWHSSECCTWLNNDFYNEAFSEAEKDKIIECEIQTKNYGSDTADSTPNRVFLLSTKEMNEYVKGKKYAKILINDSAIGWFLRDKAENQTHIAYVDANGDIIEGLGAEMQSEQGIRPAIRIKVNNIRQE